MKTVKVSSWIAKVPAGSDRRFLCSITGRHSDRYRLRHLSVDAYNQVNCGHWPKEPARTILSWFRCDAQFHCRGHRLDVQSGPCNGKSGWIDKSIFPSSIALCKSMAYVIGVTEKEVPGSIGVPRHVMGSLIMDGSWKSSRPRLRSS